MSSSYELIRYLGMPFAQTHPDRLATMAALFGMSPTPIHRARVLEIGCCDGGNLIPMALTLPESEFIGIDLTEVDIVEARETAAALGLANVHFHVLDLTTLPGDLGLFDYIIAHGVYSWVPPGVREQLLAVIQASLTPSGVAYVSYNTLPGGHIRIMLREMMLFHSKGIEDAGEVLARSRQLLDFIAASGRGEDEYQTFIRKETEQMFSRPNYGLFHDELEDNYYPVYFHDFLAHAARCGLQYVSEANYFDMRTESIANADSPVLAEANHDPLLREQYLDFARCRRFRQTLLCHANLNIERSINHNRLQEFFFASPARQVASSEGSEEFHGPHNSKIKTAHPLVLRLIHQMVEAWPSAIPFQAFGVTPAELPSALEILHALFASGLIELRTGTPWMALVPGERPTSSPLARRQAVQSLPITTLRHTSLVTQGDLERRLIALLDGTRTRQELYGELAPLLNTSKSETELMAELETSLHTLGRLCLLVS